MRKGIPVRRIYLLRLRYLAQFGALFVLLTLSVLPMARIVAQLPSPTPQPSATPQPITITIWHDLSDARAELLAHLAADYSQIEPNVTITVSFIPDDLRTSVLDAIRRDQGPDLFVGRSGWAAGLAADRRIAPLNDRLDKDFRAQILDKAWATVTVRDTIYGVPFDFQTMALLVNADLSSGTNLPATAEDLLAQAPSMMFDFYTTAGLYLGLGGALLDDTGRPALGNKPEALSAYLMLLQRAYATADKAGTLAGARIPVATDRRFRDGKATYLIASSERIADIQTVLGGKLRSVALPPLANGSPWQAFVTSDSLYLNIYSRQSDAAMRFARYLTGQAAQKNLGLLSGAIPVNPDAPQLAGTIALQTQARNGVPVPNGAALADLWPVFDDAVVAVTIRKQPPSQVSQTVLQAVEALRSRPTPTGSP